MTNVDWESVGKRAVEENRAHIKNNSYSELIGTSQTPEEFHRALSKILEKEQVEFDSLAIVRSVTPPSGKPDLIQVLEADGAYEQNRGEVFKSEMSLCGLAMSSRTPQYVPVVAAYHDHIILPDGVSSDAAEYAFPIKHGLKFRPSNSAILLRKERQNGFTETDLQRTKETLIKLSTPLGLVLSNFESAFDPMCRTIYGGGYLPHAFAIDFEGARKRRTSYAMVFIDLDDFKRINDTYGHLDTDNILYAFGELLREGIRERDVVGRHSGDQFEIGIRGITEQLALDRLEGIRSKAQDIGESLVAMTLGLPADTSISFSAGVALYDPLRPAEKQCKTSYELIDVADDALYQAKREGKSKTVISYVS